MRASADQLRLLTDAAPIGIFQTDSQNRYVYTNPRWSEITRIPPEQAAGREWDTIIDAQQRADLAAEMTEGSLRRSELAHRFEIHPHGSAARIVMVTSKSMPDANGGIAGWVGTLADVTAEAWAEGVMADARDKATEASRLKSDFLANMSHEIRTPMNGVIGMTDLLLETDLDARQRDYAQTVRNSGEALLTIINDILDFSKIEAGKLEVEHIDFEVRAVVEDVVDLLAGSAQAKGLELMAIVESAVPAVLRGDPVRVRQVLTNLLGNAIKFTATGEIVVRVTELANAGAGTIVRFVVSDTGDGIAPEKLGLIFEPFVQGDTSTTRRYGGTGLGLAITGQLVALMGGTCGVSSQLGEGSQFWFTVLLHATAGEATPGRSGEDTELAGVTALVVEGNATHRQLLSDCLSEWGLVVTTADSGPAAVAALNEEATRSRPFAVALLDRSIPGIDGLELENAVAAGPDLVTGLVFMTGFGHELDFGHAGELGNCSSLSKPIHREQLRACLRQVVGVEAVGVKPAEAIAEDAAPAGEGEGGRLLLAEDNLINQKVAVAILSTAGYRVDTVIDGVAAVAAIGLQTYDAILMDCQMPEMNGYEATAAIRAHEGSTRHTPIIAMTAGARPVDEARCLAAGMDSYVAKPVSKDALLALVARSVASGRSSVAPGVSSG